MDSYRQPDTRIPRLEARLIIARLLHCIHRLGHGAYSDIPFMQSIDVTMIVTAIFSGEHEGRPFTTLGLAQHLQMPRTTLIERIKYLRRRGIVLNDERLRVNPQMFRTATRDQSIHLLIELIIDAGSKLSKLDMSDIDSRSNSPTKHGDNTNQNHNREQN